MLDLAESPQALIGHQEPIQSILHLTAEILRITARLKPSKLMMLQPDELMWMH